MYCYFEQVVKRNSERSSRKRGNGLKKNKKNKTKRRGKWFPTRMIWSPVSAGPTTWSLLWCCSSRLPSVFSSAVQERNKKAPLNSLWEAGRWASSRSPCLSLPGYFINLFFSIQISYCYLLFCFFSFCDFYVIFFFYLVIIDSDYFLEYWFTLIPKKRR